MSDIVFKGKIPVPSYKIGDLSKAYATGVQLGQRDRAMDIQEDKIELASQEMEAKRKAAQAKQVSKLKENEAKILAQLGGIYPDGHPLALPFFDEAYSMLEQQLQPLMYQENGAEVAKLLIGNWTKSAEKYITDSDMRDNEGRLNSMLDPQSSVYAEENKSLGALFRPNVTLDHIESARSYQYQNLIQDGKLEYDNGSFTIKGLPLLGPGQGYGQSVIPLEQHPRFNDPTVFDPSTEKVQAVSLEQLGKSIQNSERVADAVWDWDKITADFKGFYEGSLPFETLDRASNESYQYRFAVFNKGKDAIQLAAPELTREMSSEELLDIYSLDEKYALEKPILYKLVKEQLKSSFNTDLKPHTRWDTDPDDDETSLVNMLQSSESGPLNVANYPRVLTPQADGTIQDEIYGFLKVPANDGDLMSATFAVDNLPNKQFESTTIPMVNRAFYEDLMIYEAAGLITYTPTGRPQILEENLAGASPRMRDAITTLFAKEDLMESVKLNSLVTYKGNPDAVGYVSSNGILEVIDSTNPKNAREQVVLANIRSGLNKMGYEWNDLFNYSLENHFQGEAGGFDPNDY